MDDLSAMLEDIGYVADDRVGEPGEMAVRGDVVDVFPADAGLPDFDKDAARHGLEARNDRLVLAGATDIDERIERVQTLMEELAA